MPVVAVLNPKGGSGKSTVATHVATAWAREGHKVMLGDVDRQQSVKSWLKRRSDRETSILTWVVDQRNVFRAPTGVTHVVLDTPGALYGHDLARVVMWLDAVVVPVGPSIFDRDASMLFLRQLLALPRVKSGRCRVCMVGMRWSPRDLDSISRDLCEHMGLSLLCVIPEERLYRECLEQGVTVFDDSVRSEPRLLEPWRPLLEWLRQTHPQFKGVSDHGHSVVMGRVPVREMVSDVKTNGWTLFPRDMGVVAKPMVGTAELSTAPVSGTDPAAASVAAHATLTRPEVNEPTISQEISTTAPHEPGASWMSRWLWTRGNR